MNAKERLAHCTVLIETESSSGNIGSGTGFFFELKIDGKPLPLIVTNKHVVDSADKFGTFRFTLTDEQDRPKLGEHKSVGYHDFKALWLYHPDPEVDLCVFPLNTIFKDFKNHDWKPFFSILTEREIPSTFDQINSVEDILMTGYPSGLWDEKYNLPIVRKGITATHPLREYNGERKFVADIAAFPGSSGSPIVLIDDENNEQKPRIKLLGILYAGPTHTAQGSIQQRPIPTTMSYEYFTSTNIMMNLGYAIHSDRLLEFEDAIKATFEK